ncbi:hypothetical protein EXE48_14390 [Halorubrum sp. ASP1]|uniref:hypothetical protein n=1 Tax=Halorubrum sp. ASP1 TaxID=2518114 RepID=UPI0010F4F146|nr:hypothetical protein [Halorubrum sp. ASP1]TKX59695.1 hypothetical protein EXE48_14390 [Halorubrum sp. ASP1]
MADTDNPDAPEEVGVSTNFIPGGGITSFLPGGDESHLGIPGETIENGKYIGLARIWSGDRRVDIRFRITNDELEEKRDYYYKGEKFSTDDWDEPAASWYNNHVQLPEGVTHSLRSYIELYLEGWDIDEIGELWRLEYEEHN